MFILIVELVVINMSTDRKYTISILKPITSQQDGKYLTKLIYYN